MKRLLLLLLALVLAALALPAPALAADYCECATPEEHARRQKALDGVLASYKTIGASIALVQNGRIIDTFQYGRANRTDKTPIDSETHFRAASVTKMVSAVGLLRFVEQGKLTLDGDIGDIFDFRIRNPYYPKIPITLRQIMTHTASLSDGYHYKRAISGNIEWLHKVFGEKGPRENFLQRQPGTRVAYSNFGGGLLGAFIEQLSGETVDEYMTRTIFSPLGITAAYHTPCLPDGTRIARVYNIESGGMTLDLMASESDHFDAEPELDYIHTAGALIISAEGLAKIIIALAGDGSVDGVRLLKPETVAAMRTLQDNIGSVSVNSKRGLNLNIIPNALVKGRTLYGHQGKAYGMIAAAYFDPTDQTGVVLLTNGCDTSVVNSVARIATAVLTKAYTFFAF
ncbi:hypothetical protein FACS1894196_4550 [Clostridia bacterium]|nr:hypothetical protein FACS1894196_4550 [Clostridia bacterium]